MMYSGNHFRNHFRNHLIRAILTLAISLLASPLIAAPPEIAWQIDKQFKAPKSAVYDTNKDILYVSNINGEGTDKDGNGFISKVGTDGEIIEMQWVTGLDGPKGMAISGNTLYVSDITSLVEIDIENGKVIKRHEAEGAKFMNDVAASDDGTVYVSDMATNVIHKLSDGTLSPWVSGEELENPNGLLVEGDNLIVGSWGKMNPDFSTDVPGHMKVISLASGEITDLGDASAIGNLDGVESDGDGNYFVTDWMAGKLMHITSSGEVEELVDLEMGSADIGVIPAQDMIIIPMMMEGSLLAYKLVQ